MHKIWISEALRTNESSGLECGKEVEDQKEGPFSIESKMPHVSVWQPGETGIGSSAPGRGGQSEVTHQGEGFSMFRSISALFLFQNDATCRGGLGSSPRPVT